MNKQKALRIIDSYENSAAIRHRFEYLTMHMNDDDDFEDILWESTVDVLCTEIESPTDS